MAFESLTEKLQNVFKSLRGKGRLSEEDVKAALKEVKLALLEADVNFKVVRQFTKAVQEKAIGQDVMNGLNPAQMVIKIVNDELVSLMGSENVSIAFRGAGEITVLMMMGLQGAGKTTTAAKLAGKIKSSGKRPLLVACDVYRPAAIKQLQINGEKQGVEVFSLGDQVAPEEIARQAVEYAKAHGLNVVILDTAGRLHVDESMMEELGESFDAYECCLQKPGAGPFYEYAQAHFPVHVSCPVINGILKCMEAEAHLALKKDASIAFVEEGE